ncbi:hypothetical protein ACERK3_17020, partial [Phycisphaerales bacterium AB-hyl4]
AALQAAEQPGVRVLNAASPWVCADRPTAEILRNWYGRGVDLTYFEQAGHERSGVFDVRRIQQVLAFTPRDRPVER